MSLRKFEEFGYGEEMDPKDWPGAAATPKYENDGQKRFTKKDLMDAAYAFTDDSTKVESGFEDWYEKSHGSKRMTGTYPGPTTR